MMQAQTRSPRRSTRQVAIGTAILVVAAFAPARAAEQGGGAAPAATPAPAATAPAAAGRLIPSPEPGWPQWRGPRRDGISQEKGLLPAWPEGGPKLLWRVSELGRGWSSPVIVRDSVYITGDVGEDLVIFAFDLDGKPKWRTKNGPAWKGSYPGARACCAYSEGRLYHMNAHGRTVCLDAATGKELWAVSVLERFEGRNLTWAMAECLLVDGPRLIVTPGGKKALMAALDKTSGQTVWTTEPIPGDRAAYSSPILFEYGGRRHLAGCSSAHGFGVDADTGRLLWTVPFRGRYEATVSTPVYSDGCVFLASPDGPDGALFRLHVEAGGVRAEQVWGTVLDSLTGGVVAVDRRIYGAGYRKTRFWHALDWETGRTLYECHDLTTGAAIWADGRLYVLDQTGVAALLKPGPGGFESCGRFEFVAGARKNDVWPHPVLLDGRLYLRYHDTLACYDVRAK